MIKNKQVVLTALGGVEKYEIQILDLPDPGADEVQIKIIATGIAYADLLMRRGLYPGMPKPPFTQGYDIVGFVEKTGSGVNASWQGKRVAALIQWGGYAQYINLPEEKLVEVPDQADPAEALCLVLNYTTAYQMVHRVAELAPGQKILVQGAAGGVGTALLQLAQVMNVTVYGTASAFKHDVLKQYDAIPIDYKSEDFAAFIRKKEPQGIDAFFGITGGKSYLQAKKLLKRGGSGVIYSLVDASGMLTAIYYFTRFKFHNMTTVKKIAFYSIITWYKKHPEYLKQDLSKLFDMLVKGDIKPIIAKKISLEEVADTHKDFEENKFSGKVVIEPYI